MAFNDVAWFIFDFSQQLVAGDYILGTPTINVGAGISVVGGSIGTLPGVKPTQVQVQITAAGVSVNALITCTVTTQNGYTTTRSGIIPVVPTVPV
jgi:hypothetical protein